MIRNLAKLGFFGFLFIIIVVILVWILYIPKGELVLRISDSFKQYKSIITKFYYTAVARTQKIFKYHGQLSFRFNSAVVQNPVAGHRLGQVIQTSSFSDVADIGYKFNTKSKIQTFFGEFKISKILEHIYKILGYTDYYFVVNNYEQTLAQIPKYTTGMADPTNLKMLTKLIVCLYPLDRIGKEIPGKSPGKLEEVQNQLAFYIYEQFWPDALKKLSKETRNIIVPLSELSHNMESLEHTTIGFDILKHGTTHKDCIGISPESCAKKVRKEFEDALRSDPDNAHARFGLGIVFLRMAVDAKIDNASAYTIGQLILNAGSNIYSARSRSEFIKNLTESEDWHTILQQWPDYKDLSITNNFINSIDYYRRASEGFAKANYTETIALLAKVEEIPADFTGLLKSFECEAKLYLAKTQSEAGRLLEDFKNWSQADQSDPGWEQSYAFHACRHRINPEDALRLLDDAIGKTMEPVFYRVSRLMKGQCLAIIDRKAEAKEVARQVLDEISEKPENEDLMQVYLEFGYLFALIEDYEDAADYFIKASKLWRGYIDNVRNAPDLEDFRIKGQRAFRRFNHTVLEYYRGKDATSLQ